LCFGQGKVTADFMVDRIDEMVPRWKQCFGLHTLVVNADNGSATST
jgi:hypothetical protein